MNNMEEVRNIISEIGQKVSNLKSNLAQVRSENNVLNEEISTLESRLKEREEELKDFQVKVEEMKQRERHLLESKEVSDANGQKRDEIDALVREIDECIIRLKENNG